ncbi:MAG: hypothetical protein M1819_001502 [Sarea resinae]|nr:MAG: hypothetical protein M1819_001502 [Sarea resinae]
MANRLVQEGAKVIAVGRRQDRLDGFVHKHGKEKASAVKFDITDRRVMDQFVNNFAPPEKFELDRFHSQIDTNFSCFVDLTMKFLPFLMNQKTETSLIYTGSNLAIVPTPKFTAYSVSKAALNTFVLCLREQLKDSSVRIIEISPPPVQTELHDWMSPEIGRKLGMPLDAFTDEAYRGLASGSDQIVIGSIGPSDTFNEIIDKRRTTFENLSKMMRDH